MCVLSNLAVQRLFFKTGIASASKRQTAAVLCFVALTHMPLIFNMACIVCGTALFGVYDI